MLIFEDTGISCLIHLFYKNVTLFTDIKGTDREQYRAILDLFLFEEFLLLKLYALYVSNENSSLTTIFISLRKIHN